MSSEGIMRRARRLGLVVVLVLGPLVVSAQTPPARAQDDLDVTMRVIADPNAKVPDEIVRRIPLPKPAQTTPASGKPGDKSADKPADKPDDKPKGPDPAAAAKPPEPGRDFGQDVADDAKQRADEAKRAKPEPPGQTKPPGKPPDPPGKPPSPPGKPPG